ncbi:MAG: hypothetical protein H0T72_02220, partial [Chloroflexia bacterium]|nr:hypothetical protein [Chloroflexia bacterium]
MLIFDTETTTDPTQRLTFGCYRFGRWRRNGSLSIHEEGLFFDDELPERDPDGFAALRDFAANHDPETEGFERNRVLMFRSQADFLDNMLWPAIQQDALIVGLNLPFDLSRLARDVSPARGKHQGGFSFQFWTFDDPTTGKTREHQYRPRIRITQIDAKRSRIDTTQPKGRPFGPNGRPIVYRPGFLDLRTLAFALTDRGHSLRSACLAFGVDAGKADPGEHGRITTQYIAYARQDVKATAALLTALRADYDRHPIDLDPCRAMSPASIAKAYYRAMGITPRLARQPDFPPDMLGYAMSAYYGGRAECAIRRTPVSVVYTDVLSMYPTVNALLDLWRFHTAERIDVEDCTDEARSLLATVTPETIRDPATWPRFGFFALIVPAGGVLPVRAHYSGDGGAFNIGVNPFHDLQPHWYAGPDLAASVLLTGETPRILRAFRPVAIGTQHGLRPVSLRGTVTVDPASGDFFRTVIEERRRAKDRADLSSEERIRLDRFLKVLANSGSYGVFVESNPQALPAGETAPVTVYGPDESPFPSRAVQPETPGAFSFPPVAALITAGARLVLALIERMVRDAGGTHAFCDTDSMAIVASEHGGLVPCLGGEHRLTDGRAAIRALSWADVDHIAGDLASLNPYDRDAVPGSILKIEDVNFDGETGERRQVWCVSIAAKRYALFTISERGEPAILPGTTRHGLGFLIDPRDVSEREADALRPWEHDLWSGVVRERLGLPHDPPPWSERPAAMRHTVSSPWLLRAFEHVNAGKSYADRIKPFSFMLAVPLDHQGRPHGIAPDAPLHLVSAYDSNPRNWVRRTWTDLHSGQRFHITTAFPGGDYGTAGVKSLGSVAGAYPYHPEPKRLGTDGLPCGQRTEGVLSRRPVHAAGLVCIGKEAHRLADRDLVAGLGDVLGIHRDPRRDPWSVVVMPRLAGLASAPGGLADLADVAGMTPRRMRDALAGRSVPRTAARLALATVARQSPDLERRCCLACAEPLSSP